METKKISKTLTGLLAFNLYWFMRNALPKGTAVMPRGAGRFNRDDSLPQRIAEAFPKILGNADKKFFDAPGSIELTDEDLDNMLDAMVETVLAEELDGDIKTNVIALAAALSLGDLMKARIKALQTAAEIIFPK